MMRPSSRRRVGAGVLAVGLLVAEPSLADEPPPPASGTVGGALVGGEVVLVAQSLAGVKPWWAYAVGTTVGVGLGGYVGHRLEREAVRDVSLYLLATGLALVLPTAIWVGQAHAPKAERGLAQSALVHHAQGRWSLGVPALEVRAGATSRGVGGTPVTELRAPVLGATL